MFKKILLLLLTFHISITKTLSPEDAYKIGMQIWNNEASQRVDLLVFWNPNESFPSLGIGHNIWYPENQFAKYTEEFPKLCNYLQKNGIVLPAWLTKALSKGAPWKIREEFLQDKKRTEELRNLLSSTINLQTNFMIERLEQQWPLILEAAPAQYKDKLKNIFKLMTSSALGTYALIDYLNFKGSGLNPNEIANGYQWGLLQVLLNIPDDITKENINKLFAISAAKILLKRIENSGPNYNTIRFMHGWVKRISTYIDPNIFK